MPLAVLNAPPLTLEYRPEAVLFLPPVTLAPAWETVLWMPAAKPPALTYLWNEPTMRL